MSAEPTLPLTRCTSCHALFLPRPGACPRCGSRNTVAAAGPAVGRVLVSVQVETPPPEFASPHRLALVELPDAVRVLAVVDGALPKTGSPAVVRVEGSQYRIAGPGP
ncbi:MAG TPA: zinc ribbon domain-containing protein [Thermoplasmata archaeon]|nr:zinc ribbon domain-containing protein [Thermoplasmata archaeon]